MTARIEGARRHAVLLADRVGAFLHAEMDFRAGGGAFRRIGTGTKTRRPGLRAILFGARQIRLERSVARLSGKRKFYFDRRFQNIRAGFLRTRHERIPVTLRRLRSSPTTLLSAFWVIVLAGLCAFSDFEAGHRSDGQGLAR